MRFWTFPYKRYTKRNFPSSYTLKKALLNPIYEHNSLGVVSMVYRSPQDLPKISEKKNNEMLILHNFKFGRKKKNFFFI